MGSQSANEGVATPLAPQGSAGVRNLRGRRGKALPRRGAEGPSADAEGTTRRAFGVELRDGQGWLWAEGPQRTPTPLALASVLAESERDGFAVEVLTLCVRRHEDVAWVGPVIDWLDAHGRSVVLRTRVRLPRDFVLTLRGRADVVAIELELASLDAEVQRALLGERAAAANELLLQAQHFAAIGLRVGARLGPLLPGVHDLPTFESMLGAVASADIHAVELQLGELSAPVLERLRDVIDDAAMITLTRAFRLAPTAAFSLDFAPRVLSFEFGQALASRLGAAVRERKDVELASLARAQAWARRDTPRDVFQPSLFASVGGDPLGGA